MNIFKKLLTAWGLARDSKAGRIVIPVGFLWSGVIIREVQYEI